MKKILLMMILGALSTLSATNKMYIDSEELDTEHGAFRIHLGHNVWIETRTIHRDISGLYTLEDDIKLISSKNEYQKTWKCPYCYQYWPMGTACKNAECPSKYKLYF